jgi:peptidoglycan/xylan/chitin deacetylase (PgdA/CDA1 family)
MRLLTIASVITVRILWVSVNDHRPTTALEFSTMLGTLMGAGAAIALGAAGYQSMAPTGQWYGRTFIGLPSGAQQIALTYDDGPNDPHTLRLLDVLAKHNAKATFFLIGQFAGQRPDIVREVVKAGHLVGNHTFTHPLLIFASDQETRSQLEHCNRAIEDAIGQTPRLFRPPFGGRRPGTLGIARALGLEPIMWNITGYDWNVPPAKEIVTRVSGRIRGGDVVLLHDGSHLGMGADRAQTVLATDQMIERLREGGREFVTIDEMIKPAVRS